MRKKKQEEIIELAEEGLSSTEIAARAGVQISSVERVIGGASTQIQTIVRADGRPLATKDDLTSAIDRTRSSYAIQSERLPALVELILDRLVEKAEDPNITPQAIQALTMTYSILQTKQGDLMRALRELDSEGSAYLEADWEDINVAEDQDASTGR